MEDLAALLAEVDEQMGTVRRLYADSLRTETVFPGLQPKIKNVLENQRSALEYLASAIVDRFGKSTGRSYYPIVSEPALFDARFAKNMRGVAAARPDIRDAIEARQPYRQGYEWLGHLATLTNENKHQKLSPQQRVETRELRPGPGGAGVIGGPGASIRMTGNASIRMTGNASISFGGGPVVARNIQRRVLVDWLFADLRISALATLTEIERRLPSLISEIRQVAGL